MRVASALVLSVTVGLSACAGCPGGSTSDSTTGSSGASGVSSGGASGSGSRGSNGSASASGGGTSGASGGSGGSTGGGSGGTGSSGGGASSGAAVTVTSLVVTPAPAALVARPGQNDSLPLTVEAVLSDGTRRPARGPFFRSLAPQLGTMTGNTFVATGERGGLASVRIRADGLEVFHNVTVTVRDTEVAPGAPGGIDGAFGGAPAAAPNVPTLLYPYDQVVIPLNLAPMLFQWNTSLQNPWFHLRIQGTNGSLDLYTADNKVAPSGTAWRRLLETHAGATLSVTLEAVENGGGDRHVAAQQSIRLANADLTATVYYWALNVGRLVRIDADSLAPTELPMSGSTEQTSDSQSPCYACHALSKDGTRLSFTFNGGSKQGGLVNPSDPGTNIVGPDDTKRWNWSVISPDNRFLLTNLSTTLTLRDANTGDVVPGGEAVATNAAHPAWSPARDQIAYASVSGGNEIDFPSSDLVVRAVDPLSGMPGATTLTLPGNGGTMFYPNFSSDGQFVVFNRGVTSRSGSPATLEMQDLIMGGTPTVLTRASPEQNSYQPTFSPFVEGGYMWVAFFSRRNYGHQLTSTERQIWVAAIDQNPTPGADSSHPAFWLPGQNSGTLNMAAFFAPKPCAAAGGGCTSDLGCCGGNLCRPNGASQLVCTPPELACVLPGDTCVMDADCCVGAGTCFDNGTGVKRCTPPENQCRMTGQTCQFDSDCCVGAGTCFDNGEGDPKCTPSSQQCVMPTGACDATRPCCPGSNAACLTNTQTGTTACLRPTDQCRASGQACTVDADCCPGTDLVCDGQVCSLPGG